MRGNLGVTMTCMVNSTAVALKNLQHSAMANKTLQLIVDIPPQCLQADNTTSGVNDYGVKYSSVLHF